MSEPLARFTLEGPVARIEMDDGKANALSHAMLDTLWKALDQAEQHEAGALLVVGRPGRFSAGFDLSVMRSGIDAAMELVGRGVELLVRLYEFPMPVVAACSGHALAAGALLLLAADERIGVRGDFKIGLNEAAIGMVLPNPAIELARDRLAPTALSRSTILAELFQPDTAVPVGFLDRVVEPDALIETATARAVALSELPSQAVAGNKRAVRGPTLERMRKG